MLAAVPVFMVVAGAMETRLFQNILQTKSSFIPTRNALVGRENKMELFFCSLKGRHTRARV